LSLHLIRIFLAVTFLAVIIAILAECQPITHYWQVIPDPGPKCRTGYAQLFTMGISDSITDVLLIIFPVSIIVKSNMGWVRKIKLSFLFSLNAVPIAVTVMRMTSVIKASGRQQTRSVYASGEILAAAAVSNAVVLGSFLRDRGVKKAKFKSHSRSESSDAPQSRRVTMTKFTNESDTDLFDGMCYRSHHADVEATPRAPPVVGGSDDSDEISSSGEPPQWTRPNYEPEVGESSAAGGPPILRRQSTVPVPPETAKLSKAVTFSDPGGLLDNASSQASTIAASPSSDFSGRRWSRGRQSSILENGRTTSPNDQRPQPALRLDGLQDVGGLLG
jgi:hypothetical protein